MFDTGALTFKELRKYLSIIDRLSICRKETGEYHNYLFLEDVPESYDELYVYGIGMIQSEFYKSAPHIYKTEGTRDELVLDYCIEVMLSDQPKYNEQGEISE